MKSEFRVKNLEQKKEKTSIFIGSSTESLPVARKIKELLEEEASSYEVDIWDEDIFDPSIQQGSSEYGIDGKKFDKGKEVKNQAGDQAIKAKAPTNLDSLRNFSDIYDFAIFVFVPDDKIVSQTRKHLETKNKLKGYGTRHNLVFEFGLFLGRIGPKKTFILADDSISAFINNFFTDLRDVSLYEYKSHYAEWLKAGRSLDMPSYDSNSLSQQVEAIKTAISIAEPDIEIGFLPSTSLAIGFFENMMRLVVENLIRMKNGAEMNASKQGQGQQEPKPPLTLEFPLQRSEIRFKLVIPHKLQHASHQAYQACVNHYGLIRVAVPTPTRAITVFCHPEVLEPNGRLIIYDIPSTLFSSWNAIDLLTEVKDIRQLLDEKEKRNFKKTIDRLLEKHQNNAALVGIKHMVEVISIDEMAGDFPRAEPFVMKDA